MADAHLKVTPSVNTHKDFLDRLHRIANAHITHNSREIRELAFATIEYCKVMEKYVLPPPPLPPLEEKGDPFY